MVEAVGDGLDANGNLFIAGGTTLVVGPSSGDNGILDYDGTFSCTGGILLGVGAFGMGTPSPSNTSNYLTRGLSTSGSNIVAITDESGKVLSALKYEKSTQVLLYFNGNTTASTCKVYLNPTLDETQLNTFGYASDISISGGTEITAAASNSSRPR